MPGNTPATRCVSCRTPRDENRAHEKCEGAALLGCTTLNYDCQQHELLLAGFPKDTKARVSHRSALSHRERCAEETGERPTATMCSTGGAGAHHGHACPHGPCGQGGGCTARWRRASPAAARASRPGNPRRAPRRPRIEARRTAPRENPATGAKPRYLLLWCTCRPSRRHSMVNLHTHDETRASSHMCWG